MLNSSLKHQSSIDQMEKPIDQMERSDRNGTRDGSKDFGYHSRFESLHRDSSRRSPHGCGAALIKQLSDFISYLSYQSFSAIPTGLTAVSSVQFLSEEWIRSHFRGGSLDLPPRHALWFKGKALALIKLEIRCSTSSGALVLVRG